MPRWTLIVEVIEGKNIFHHDKREAELPVCTLSYGTQKYSTIETAYGANPSWRNSVFTFDVSVASNLSVKITDGNVCLGEFDFDEFEWQRGDYSVTGMTIAEDWTQSSERWIDLQVPVSVYSILHSSPSAFTNPSFSLHSNPLPKLHLKFTHIHEALGEDEREDMQASIGNSEFGEKMKQPSIEEVTKMYVRSQNDIAYIFCCFVVVVLPMYLKLFRIFVGLFRWEKKLSSFLVLLLGMWVIWHELILWTFSAGFCAFSFYEFIWREKRTRRKFRESVRLGITSREQILSKAQELLDQHGFFSVSSGILKENSLNAPWIVQSLESWILNGLKPQLTGFNPTNSKNNANYLNNNTNSLFGHLILITPFLCIFIRSIRVTTEFVYHLKSGLYWWMLESGFGHLIFFLMSFSTFFSFFYPVLPSFLFYATKISVILFVIYSFVMIPLYSFYPEFYAQYSPSKISELLVNFLTNPDLQPEKMKTALASLNSIKNCANSNSIESQENQLKLNSVQEKGVSFEKIEICGSILYSSGGVLKQWKKRFVIVDHNRYLYIYPHPALGKIIGDERNFAKNLLASTKPKNRIELAKYKLHQVNPSRFKELRMKERNWILEIINQSHFSENEREKHHGKLFSFENMQENSEWFKVLERMCDKGIRSSDLIRGHKALRSLNVIKRNLEGNNRLENKNKISPIFLEAILTSDYHSLSSIFANQVIRGTPLHDYLLEMPIDIDEQNTPLIYAVCQNSLQIAKLLILQGSNLNAKDFHGFTPLFHSLMNGFDKITLFLLDQVGINIRAKSVEEYSCLHFFARGKKTENSEKILAKLLEMGACIDEKNRNGETPLHSAVLKKQAEMVKLLLKYGANYSIKTDSGFTAKGWAEAFNLKNISHLIPSDGEKPKKDLRNIIFDTNNHKENFGEKEHKEESGSLWKILDQPKKMASRITTNVTKFPKKLVKGTVHLFDDTPSHMSPSEPSEKSSRNSFE